jgi:hypothetical protein
VHKPEVNLSEQYFPIVSQHYDPTGLLFSSLFLLKKIDGSIHVNKFLRI